MQGDGGTLERTLGNKQIKDTSELPAHPNPGESLKNEHRCVIMVHKIYSNTNPPPGEDGSEGNNY